VRVHVTGAAGFIGRHLVPRLEGAGWAISRADRAVDVSDARAVDRALERAAPDAVVHLAAVSSVAASEGDPERTRRVNVEGTRALLAATARRAPHARVLLIGSGQQYGTTRSGPTPFDESAPLRPDSTYAETKAEAEQLGAEYAQRGLDVIRVRAFNHVGPGQSDAFVVSSFAKQIAEIECGCRDPVLRVGNLDSVRDFLDVQDAVEAYAALLHPALASGVYNVASGVGVRVGDVLEALLALTPRRSEIEVEVDPARLRPTSYSVGDATRVRAATGWQPRVPLADTLARTLEAWRAELSAA